MLGTNYKFQCRGLRIRILKFDARRRTDPQLLEAILSPNFVSVLSFCGGRGEKLEKLKLAKVYDEYDDIVMNDKDVICRGKKTKHRLEFAPKTEQTAKEQNECPLTK